MRPSGDTTQRATTLAHTENDSGIRGRVAFVTGAGAGIGRAIALEWSRRGGITIATDVVENDARDVVSEIHAAGGMASAFQLDVRNLEQIRSVLLEGAGSDGLDVLFNVAGTNLPKTVEETSDDEWHAIVDINLTSVYRCSKYALPHLRLSSGGAIVNVASIAGVIGESHCAAYTASKGGVVQLTRNMAMDLADAGIRVNAICPGSTRTPRLEKIWRESGLERGEPPCPMRRYAEPIEIARPAVFLASTDASYITGAALVVDGGLTAGFRIRVFDSAQKPPDSTQTG